MIAPRYSNESNIVTIRGEHSITLDALFIEHCNQYCIPGKYKCLLSEIMKIQKLFICKKHSSFRIMMCSVH